MNECLFCKIISRQIPSSVVYEDDTVVAFLDINPVNPGHTLVVPKEHSDSMLTASGGALTAMVGAVQKVVPAVLKATGNEDWNLEVNNGARAGQIIMHTHWHIVPRRMDDGLRHWPGHPYAVGEADKVAEAIRSNL